MNGDLSLSQSLGGLRIANPDHDDQANSSPPQQPANLPSRPPAPSSRSSDSTVTGHSTLLPDLNHEDGLGFDPDTYALRETHASPPQPSPLALRPRSPTSPPTEPPRTRLNHRQSMPFTPQHQPGFQYPPQQSSYSPSLQHPLPPGSSSRPMSGIYAQPNNSSSSHMSSQGSYRYRDEMYASDGMSEGVARSGSRSTRAPMAGVATRETGRIYRQPSTQANGSNGMLPLRSNSRRGRAPTGGSAGYDATDPYAGNAPVSRSADASRETDASGQPKPRSAKKGVQDFNFGRTLGEGSYSTVLAATDRQTNKEYAIKVLDKRHIIREKKVKYVNIERDTLNRLTEHPGIVRLYYTFQDERSLYFVLDLASGGELLGVLKKMGSFDVECTRHYGAELLDSIAYMHSRGVIHRDLKPENVLLDRDMHTKITDFGTAKILPNPRPNGANGADPAGHPIDGAESDRAKSFVGTAEYVSPELLRDKNACKASDLWAFGCIVYQLLAGRPPFKAANEYLTFQKILGLEYSFPDGFPEQARDLVERLLVLDPAQRLPMEHIKNHPFFQGVLWGRGLWRQKPPRLKAHTSPAADPLRLNGTTSNQSSTPAPAAAAAAAMQMTGQAASQPQVARRPQLQTVTDLPPPSQLDIDWSPVLTNNNERILKLGNLIVTSAPHPHSPTGKSGDASTTSEKPKFSRFFSGTTGKKRERLVLITSSARLVIAAAGGNEKKAKMDLNLLANGSSCKGSVDGKGLTYWSLDSREKHFTFEDPRATTSDPAGSKYSTQEWLDAVEQAREIAIAASMTSSYSGESVLNDVNATSNLSSPSDHSLGGDAAMPMSGPSVGDRHMLRHTLRKNTDEESLKGRKRFSKRHSKSGFAAVF